MVVKKEVEEEKEEEEEEEEEEETEIGLWILIPLLFGASNLSTPMLRDPYKAQKFRKKYKAENPMKTSVINMQLICFLYLCCLT